MFKNQLKIAWRNIVKDKMFSTLNILGLSLGIAITLILFLFIKQEKSFDSMYANKARIARVLVHTNQDNQSEIWANASPAVGPALMTDIPQVEYAARMLKNDFGGTASVRANEANYTEDKLFWVDQELLTIFDVEFIEGKREGALDSPNKVVLSESIAKKYFGSTHVLGKTIAIDAKPSLEVTGVYKDFASNSTIDCDIMGSFKSTWFANNNSWNNASFETYCLLQPNSSITALQPQLQALLDKNVEKEDQWYSLSLQPLEEVHLYSADFADAYTSRIGDIKDIKNLSFLAILILLIASINYMNLMTARSQKRAKEVGINKTLGASASNMVGRFYVETGLITAISIVLGIVLAVLMLPLFNHIAHQELVAKTLFTADFLLLVFAVWFVLTLVAGLYPSLYLSRFLPAMVLKASNNQTKANGYVRQGLVVLQFVASVILIIGVLVVYQQIQFIQDKKLGFNPENVIAISTLGIKGEAQNSALLQEFKRLSNVSSVAMAQGLPGMDVSGRDLYKREDDERGVNIQTNVADAGIIDVLQLRLLAGKTLPEVKAETDSITDVVLNKKSVDFLGYAPEEAVGKTVYMSGPVRVIGVVDNFNYASLHKPIGAYAFHNGLSEMTSFLIVRYNALPQGNHLAKFENAFQNVASNVAFNYSFLHQNIEKLYEKENRTANVGISFCILAIFIACLGLFGLAAFTAEQRKKEIGIRKVLGSNVAGIVKMLSTDFMKLVGIALLIAFPIAYFIMQNWLESFAYRVSIHIGVFILAGIGTMVIALITVSFQSIKAAVVNPVKSLRSE